MFDYRQSYTTNLTLNQNYFLGINHHVQNIQYMEHPLNLGNEIRNKVCLPVKQEYKDFKEYSYTNIIPLTYSSQNEEDDQMNCSTSSNNSNGWVNTPKNKFKTEICKYWELNKSCKFKDNCAFAHGINEIRQKAITTTNYKTKKCKQFFENGYCSYGTRCQFLHHLTENSQNFSYKKVISDLIDPKISSFEIIPRPRLKTFENLANSKSDNNREGFCQEILKIKLNTDF